MSKQLTAAAVLLLQAQGRLQLTGRLCDNLSGCPEAWMPITHEQLLSDTSGIPGYLTDLAFFSVPESPSWYVEGLRSLPLHFSPAARLSYSSSNYFCWLCSWSGSPVRRFSDFLAAEVFGPLQMANTGADTMEIRPGHAVGSYADGTVPPAFHVFPVGRWESLLHHRGSAALG